MGRLYQAYFADKTVGIKEELNAGKETDKVSRIGIPAASESKATRIKDIIQKSSAKKSKSNIASYLTSDIAKSNPDITISISLDKTSLGGSSQVKPHIEPDDDDDVEDMDSMTPMGTKRKKSMVNMSRGGRKYSNFIFGSIPSNDEAYAIGEGRKLGELKQPYYAKKYGNIGRLGGLALGVGATAALPHDIFNTNILAPELFTMGAGGAVLGDYIGKDIGSNLAVPLEIAKATKLKLSGIQAPIQKRINELNTPSSLVSNVTEEVSDALDSTQNIGSDLLDNTDEFIDSGKQVGKRLLNNPNARLGASGLGVAGLAGSAGAYLANRNQEQSNMSSRYAQAPRASFKHGVYRDASFGILDGISKTTETGPTLENLRTTGSVAGGLVGGSLGAALPNSRVINSLRDGVFPAAGATTTKRYGVLGA
jgi:hypothetical protein